MGLPPDVPVTPVPGRIDRLPRNKAGYPVPWFVAWIDGKPDFRVIRQDGIRDAVARRVCWVCGTVFRRQEDRAFVIGPMCAVNRVSAEPPSHEDCAAYSAGNCPFLVVPQMVRRDRRMPGDVTGPAGVMIRRNPGVTLVWVTRYRDWSPFDAGGGTLFDVGEPRRAAWYARGRAATRGEVLASMDSGFPLLAEAAEAEGPEAVAELARMHERALALVPAA